MGKASLEVHLRDTNVDVAITGDSSSVIQCICGAIDSLAIRLVDELKTVENMDVEDEEACRVYMIAEIVNAVLDNVDKFAIPTDKIIHIGDKSNINKASLNLDGLDNLLDLEANDSEDIK